MAICGAYYSQPNIVVEKGAQPLSQKFQILNVTKGNIDMEWVLHKVTMTTKPIRLTSESEGIALKYGSTVSKGILEMEHRLGQPQLQTVTGVLQNATSLRGGMSAEYWKELRKEVDAAIEKYSRGY